MPRSNRKPRAASAESPDSPFEVLAPARQSLPLVLASPHSGADYPAGFLARTRLKLPALRRSEDSFIDELFAAAPALGAPLLRARFPRAYLDVNREPFELDPSMFADRLPGYANTASPRVRAGLGTIPRLAASGAEIYDAPLAFAEARRRIRGLYLPYHKALRALVAQTRARFGYAILIDCHSMPSQAAREGWSQSGVRGHGSVDVVLGDYHGSACATWVVRRAEQTLTGLGYRVSRNVPYAGGFTTAYYGRPQASVHALQIEVNRALYMDEQRIERRPEMDRLAADLGRLIVELGSTAPFARAAE